MIKKMEFIKNIMKMDESKKNVIISMMNLMEFINYIVILEEL